MAVTNIKIERFSVISSKPFDAVVAAIKASVGQPDMTEFAKAIRSAPSFAELERCCQRSAEQHRADAVHGTRSWRDLLELLDVRQDR